MQDEPPTWPSDSDDNMGLESMSEPDDLDLDDDEDGLEVNPGGDNDNSGEEVANDDENDNDNDEPFFDTQSASAGSSVSHGRTSQAGRSDKGSKSEEVDTEDDPVGPITPGPGSKFEFVNAPSTAKPRKGTSEDNDSDEAESIRPDEGAGMGDDDIEDDWIDPSISSPTPIRTVPSKEPSPSPPSSSNVPRLAKGRPTSLKSRGSSSKSKQKTGKQTPVPVPSVTIPTQPQEHYPFPVAPADDGTSLPRDGERSRQSSATRMPKQPRMHTTRARDGGRTQSGGVKGILPNEPV